MLEGILKQPLPSAQSATLQNAQAQSKGANSGSVSGGGTGGVVPGTKRTTPPTLLDEHFERGAAFLTLDNGAVLMSPVDVGQGPANGQLTEVDPIGTQLPGNVFPRAVSTELLTLTNGAGAVFTGSADLHSHPSKNLQGQPQQDPHLPSGVVRDPSGKPGGDVAGAVMTFPASGPIADSRPHASIVIVNDGGQLGSSMTVIQRPARQNSSTSTQQLATTSTKLAGALVRATKPGPVKHLLKIRSEQQLKSLLPVNFGALVGDTQNNTIRAVP